MMQKCSDHLKFLETHQLKLTVTQILKEDISKFRWGIHIEKHFDLSR